LSTIFSGLPSLKARARWMSLPWRARFGDVLAADELRIGRGHLHGQVLHQLLEIVGARHEIGLAVHLDQHAQLRARMNVAADHALLGGARGLLRRRGDARLRSTTLGFRQIALGLDQRLLALHHPAPVRSRSCFTSCALISIIRSFQNSF
jgi:hypothetical protein